MITCKLMGGLGNQLFQIFTTISYAIQTNNEFKFAKIKHIRGCTPRHTYWDTFFKYLHPFLTFSFPDMTMIKEKEFAFNELIINSPNTILNGYFQSYKYFETHYSTICEIIHLEELKQNVLTKINIPMDSFVSLHFRIGDYTQFPNIYPIASIDYYTTSIQYLCKHYKESFTIMYFCEDGDVEQVTNIIQTLLKTFPSIDFIRCESTYSDWEQLLLMSCCCHNIIANSSFSWWGAYFNNNTNKIVCYPSKWFEVSHNTTDLCPENWIKI
jgi:hypothetical protein